jgi:hypothetical protein
MFSAPLEPLSPGVLAELLHLSAIDHVVHDCAEHWADDVFDAPDGRRFRLLYDGCTIFSRDRQLNAVDRTTLDEVAGAIAELDSNDKPLRFDTVENADQAWADLQALFGVKSRLASDPDWGTFPEPTEPSVQ